MKTLIVITMLFGIIYSVYSTMEMNYSKEFYDNFELLENMLLAARFIKFFGEVYLHIVFLNVVKFLL